MAISLKKGGRINLAKEAPSLKRIRAELSWEPNKTNTGSKFDLDVSVFILKAGEPNNQLIADEYMVFYGNKTSPEGAVTHKGDNKTGDGLGPDEVIFIDLPKMNPSAVEVSFIVTIHDADVRRQNFGQVPKSGIKLFDDETGELLASYDLEENFSLETAVQFGSLYLKDGGWNFKAVGAGYNLGLGDFVVQYGGEVEEG